MNLRNGFNFAKKVMATGECDLLILDEVLGLVDQEVISREEFIRFLQSADDETDLIMTGRVCPDEIRQYADQILLCGKSVMAGDPGPDGRKFKS